MHLAILSDIHSNLPALEAVLSSIERAGVERRWCLGDVVGYGAEPDACARLVDQSCELCLVGNHDLAVLGQLDISSFSPAAAAAARWTQSNVERSTLDFLRGLEPSDESHEVALYHASPRDPVWEYVLWPDQAAECIAAQAARVSLVGHSHVALHFSLPEDGPDGPVEDAPAGGSRTAARATGARERLARGAQAGHGTTLRIEQGSWLINPGSVGQPRDGDPRAAWLELDTEAWTATYHRTEYAIDRAAEAIAATELPEHLGRRLYAGQ